jgi:outer membrane protein OmpA-like peptidoglycan-associated protein
MSYWPLWLAFAVAEGALIYSCVASKAQAIQAELERRSVAALRAQNVSLGADFVMDGRDAWLTGAVATADAKAAAEKAVAEVRGVRMVRNLLHVDGEAPAQVPPAEVETAVATPPAEEPPPPAAPAPPVERPPDQETPPAPARAPAAQPAPPPTALSEASRSGVQRFIDELIGDRVVEFRPSSDRLTDDSAALVDQVAALLARYPSARIEIAGHTDSQGTSRNNMTISQRRAEAVRRRLVTGGVEASRLTARGYGEDRPIADNATSQGRLRNRRVELTVQ